MAPPRSLLAAVLPLGLAALFIPSPGVVGAAPNPSQPFLAPRNYNASGPTTGDYTASLGASAPYTLRTPPLDTPWTTQVGLSPWPQHPRPQSFRPEWTSLNGLWTWEPADGLDAAFDPPESGPLEQQVLVPSCVESGLSGVAEMNVTYMWYRTVFSVPKGWNNGTGDGKVLLHFEAVDYEATVFLNGQEVGFHRGGYFGFEVDVSECVDLEGENEL
jgi:hypothetical protein